MVAVTETLIDGDAERYEQRYSLRLLDRVPLDMVRRPMSLPPPVNTVQAVDDGPRHGRIAHTGVGLWDGEQWRRVKFAPTHWTEGGLSG